VSHVKQVKQVKGVEYFSIAGSFTNSLL